MSENDKTSTTDSVPEEKPAPRESSKLDEFAKTGIAAKLSGKFHETAGTIKQKIGNVADNPELINQGKKQVLLGRVHRFVGALRSAKEGLQSVGGKLVDDIKNVFKE